MSVILRKRKNLDGTTSLLLDIYNNGIRRREFLKHLKLSKPSNPADRQANKDKLIQAKKIEIKMAQDLSANDYNMPSEAGKKTIVTEWMQSFIDRYEKKDKRNMQGALNRFRDFLIKDKKQGLTFGRLNDLIISDFRDFLQAKSKGEGATSYFSRFKKMIKQAYREKIIQNNPAADVKRPKGTAREKDKLTLDEIKQLAATPIESSEVRRAFLYSCFTGLRWIDVKSLKWSSIDLKNRVMKKEQSKVDGEAKEVTINLNDASIKLLGTAGKANDFVFNLPTANGANKTVKAWVKRAGIKNKKITWHNARHSFGTNLIYYGADITTASSLLGHSTLRHTQRYVKAAKELKQKATDNINIDI